MGEGEEWRRSREKGGEAPWELKATLLLDGREMDSRGARAIRGFGGTGGGVEGGREGKGYRKDPRI